MGVAGEVGGCCGQKLKSCQLASTTGKKGAKNVILRSNIISCKTRCLSGQLF